MDETIVVPGLRLEDLGRAGGLTVWSFRALAMGHGPCPVLSGALMGRFADAYPAVLADLHTFVQMVGYLGQRKIRLSVPGCLCVTRDERIVIGALAAVQGGDAAGARDRLADLLDRPPSAALERLLDSIVGSFSAAGLRFDPPPGEAADLPVRLRMLRRPSATATYVAEAGHA